jgi:hypothetical protein
MPHFAAAAILPHVSAYVFSSATDVRKMSKLLMPMRKCRGMGEGYKGGGPARYGGDVAEHPKSLSASMTQVRGFKIHFFMNFFPLFFSCRAFIVSRTRLRLAVWKVSRRLSLRDVFNKMSLMIVTT